MKTGTLHKTQETLPWGTVRIWPSMPFFLPLSNSCIVWPLADKRQPKREIDSLKTQEQEGHGAIYSP